MIYEKKNKWVKAITKIVCPKCGEYYLKERNYQEKLDYYKKYIKPYIK